MQQFNDAGRTLFVNWSYSREEWNKFSRLKSLEKGYISFVFHILRIGRIMKPPQVMITEESVFIDGQNEVFNSPVSFLKRANITERDNINLIEIDYYSSAGDNVREIRLPVPRGRLKEAIALEERLNELRLSRPGWLQ